MKTIVVLAVLIFAFDESHAYKYFVKVETFGQGLFRTWTLSDVQYEADKIEVKKAYRSKGRQAVDVHVQGGPTDEMESAIDLLYEDNVRIWIAQFEDDRATIATARYREIRNLNLPTRSENSFSVRGFEVEV